MTLVILDGELYQPVAVVEPGRCIPRKYWNGRRSYNFIWTSNTDPTSEDAIAVFVNGLVQDTANWSLIGADVIVFVFSIAPAAASDIYVYYLTNGTPTPVGPTGTQNVEYRTLSGGEAAAEKLDTFCDSDVGKPCHA